MTKDLGSECLEAFSTGIDMASALQPQTILALNLEEKRRAPPWDAPLRLRIPTKLASKSARNLEAIEVTNKYPWATGKTKAVTGLLAFDGAAGNAIRSLIPDRSQLEREACSDPLHMKAWLTTAALLLGLGQLVTAARIYGRLHIRPEGRFYPLLHCWSGRAAVLLTLPAAYHCIFRLGFGTYDARILVHSSLGASFYGAFLAKVLIVRTSGYPGWVLPMAGGALFGSGAGDCRPPARHSCDR